MKKITKFFGTIGKIGFFAYIVLFIIFYFDLDGKFLFHVVEPFLVKHYDEMERRNPLEQPYSMIDKDNL